MTNQSRWKPAVILSGLVLLIVICGYSAVATVSARSGSAPTKSSSKHLNPNNNPFCSRLGHSIQASQGAQMFCFPPQPTATAQAGVRTASSGTSYAPNVDAANPQEDAWITQLWPDQETYKREEQRRFEILLAHWDLPVTDITPSKK